MTTIVLLIRLEIRVTGWITHHPRRHRQLGNLATIDLGIIALFRHQENIVITLLGIRRSYVKIVM
jgi:hypothetical protein